MDSIKRTLTKKFGHHKRWSYIVSQGNMYVSYLGSRILLFRLVYSSHAALAVVIAFKLLITRPFCLSSI